MGRPAIRRRSQAFLQTAPRRGLKRDAPGVGRARLRCESRGRGICAPSPLPRGVHYQYPGLRFAYPPATAVALKTSAVGPTTATMTDDATLPGWRHARWGLGALGVLLAACAVHALAKFDAGPLSWLLEKSGYNVVLVG